MGVRYQIGLADAEWAVIKPLMPGHTSRGRLQVWPMLEILNAMVSRSAQRYCVDDLRGPHATIDRLR